MPVGVIGAGPVGLYAAFRLVKAGHSVVIFEAGAEVASAVKGWGHVTLFSEFSLNMPRDAVTALETGIGSFRGVSLFDPEAYLTGGEFRTSVLLPLAKWLVASKRCEIRCGRRVVGLARGRLLKGEGIVAAGDSSRSNQSFRVVFEDSVEGGFSAVVDASGTYASRTANRSGVGGVTTPGEKKAEADGKILRVIPSNLAQFAGQHVGILGSGYSAVTTLKLLCDSEQAPKTVCWMVRRPGSAVYKTMEGDPLPQRNALASYGNTLARCQGAAALNGAQLEVESGVAITSIADVADGSIRVTLEKYDVVDDSTTETTRDLDMLISLVGYRPDSSIYSELHMHSCYASEGPIKLAATLIGGGDCLKQAAPGVGTLLNPEPNFFIIGMKSYGRNSSFLMRVGYEQVGLLVDTLKDLAENAPLLDGGGGGGGGASAAAAAALTAKVVAKVAA